MKRKLSHAAICLAGVLLLCGNLAAGEKKLMHCFAFTPIDGATDSDWQAFYKSTDALPGKIPGLTKVWYGKLRRELGTGDPKAARKHGVCMEMASEDTLKTYTAHPAHKEWEAVYSKVREPGTTTFDILCQ